MVAKKRDKKTGVADLIPELIRDMGWKKQLDLHSIFPMWKELVNANLASYSIPLKIERNVLWIEVENSAWLQQFQYEKIELLEDLNNYLQLGQLKDIRMVLPTSKTEKERAASQPPKREAIRFVKPDDEKIEAFQHQVESIADEKCRESLMQFWYLSQACKRNKK